MAMAHDATVAETKPPRRKSGWKESRLISPAVLVAFLLFWETAIHLAEIPPIVLPPPSAVFVSLYQGIVTGLFLPHFLVTLWEVVAGFVVGAGIGMVLGVLIGLSPFLERVFYPYVVAFQTVPKVAIAPIVVIWFGYGLSSKIIITAMIAFFPVLANMIVGLRSAPLEQIEMLKSFTASKWRIFRMAKLPNAMPFVFAGLDIAIIVAVIGAIVGEFVGARAGLGYLIMQMNFTFDMAGVFAVLIILSAIGIGLHWIVVLAERKVLFWAESNSRSQQAGG